MVIHGLNGSCVGLAGEFAVRQLLGWWSLFFLASGWAVPMLVYVLWVGFFSDKTENAVICVYCSGDNGLCLV